MCNFSIPSSGLRLFFRFSTTPIGFPIFFLLAVKRFVRRGYPLEIDGAENSQHWLALLAWPAQSSYSLKLRKGHMIATMAITISLTTTIRSHHHHHH